MEKPSSPCGKFQANIFNQSKCQNCFKARELHLLTGGDMEQAKPIYGGWLCLAPEGTDFDNPMQRSRKWQRRFFILYEHGSLSFALDELRSTLPQGTVNMNLCTDITDAEPRTGQRNALSIVTPEHEIFIRGDSKEIIHGWSEQLAVYLRTNKQNQKKKRKVEPVGTQEPSPAKMAATDPSCPSLESPSESSRWQEDQQGGGAGVTPLWTVTDTDAPGPEQTPAGDAPTYVCPVSMDSMTSDSSFSGTVGSLDLVANGSTDSDNNNQLAESNNIQISAKQSNKNQNRDKSLVRPAERLVGVEKEQRDLAAISRQGRSEARSNKREKLQSCGDIAQLTTLPPQRRAKSLDRRTSDTVMTPDLLNFKKGWMVKLDENDQWKKYWFVLSTDSLRYYKDSLAEEASDLKGEIDLTKCYNVSEYQVQRNYGFQIHTPQGVYTLSAMTAGIRKNWIQALMRNVHPAHAPDVASLNGHHGSCSPPEALPKPDVTQDSPSTDASTEKEPQAKHRSVMERRREGRYRTFDWAEFRPQSKATLVPDTHRTKDLGSLELGDLERRKRREERRKRYESTLGFSLGWELIADKTPDSCVRALSPKSQQKVEEEIEECWKQVEKTVFRSERKVPLFPVDGESVEVEKLLDSYRKGVEDLQAQLAESENRRLELEAQLSTAGYYQRQRDPPLTAADICQLDTNEQPLNSHTQTLTDAYKETRELLQQQNVIRQVMQKQLSSEPPPLTPHTPSIWLHDAEGNFQELSDLLPETVATPLLSPASDGQHLLSQGDGLTIDLDVATTNQHNELHCQQFVSSSLILENPTEGHGHSLSCCVEHRMPPDEAMVKSLSQEVELLTSQNQALNQRNQEMLHQLTEADREIERLKAELGSRHPEPHLFPEDVERELSLRKQQLLEAHTLITSLEENLMETEALLQLNVPAEREGAEREQSGSADKAEGYLLQCLEAAEAKLAEQERRLNESELTCRALQMQNMELKEAEKLSLQTAAEAEADIRRLNEELERERRKDGGSNGCVSGEEKIQQVIEGMAVRLKALGKLLEVIDKLDVVFRRDESKPTVASQLKREEEFWRWLFDNLQSNTLQLDDEKCAEVIFREVTERMIVEKRMLLLGHGLLSETDSCADGDREGLKDLDSIWNTGSETAIETKKTDKSRILYFNYQPCELKHFRVVTEVKLSLLNQLASSVSTTAHNDELRLMVDRLPDCHWSQHLWPGFIHSAAIEAFYCCHLSLLQSQYERELEDSKQKLLTPPLVCSNCVDLVEENRELRATLTNLEEEQLSSLGNKKNKCCQTEETYSQDTDIQLQAAGESRADGDEEEEDEMVESEFELTENPFSCVEGQRENTEKSEASHSATNSSSETERVLVQIRVKELEEQLTVMAEQMKEELDGKMSSAQIQHDKEMEKLKITCERGFASMEESHLKVVEELQHRHQQEVERLLVERDRLLEEECAATATAIEAIRNAHRLELEREVQRRWRSESSTGNTHLEDIYRQHREELESFEQELQVLSQQFSLKCLENGHLVQALDAERKALCQCQQENQDLRTRNQELSGHLAAEITRLCCLAKQDALPLTPGMDVYQMEITLRVKESEVQCLKQEITSLKDELQAAQRDKRNVTKKYKDVCAELSITRAKTEGEVEELRENLRLAHRALDQTSL